MIKFENVVLPSAEQWRAIILGSRNPLNSWEKSDSHYCNGYHGCEKIRECDSLPNCYEIGPNDLDLMRRLASGGPVHAKYRRMITVYVDITAPLYWWKEFDTYKVGTVANSCSTMHKIADKEFTLEDFSHEHLIGDNALFIHNKGDFRCISNVQFLMWTIDFLNENRRLYLETSDELKKAQESYIVAAPDAEEKALKIRELQKKKKMYWWQMIQLLPSSYNQKRTVMTNYEMLANVWGSGRRNHNLDEWVEHPSVITKLDILSVGLTKDGLGVRGPIETNQEYFGFCDWIKTLPYAELITGEKGESKK